MRRRRRVYHPRRRAPAAAAARRPAVAGAAAGTKSYARRGAEAAQPIRPGELRVLICGAVFILLVALKLALPDNMASARAALGRWLVRDADFTAAFSAVGRAVSGEGGVLDSVEDAYVAVFGESAATEVSKPVELETAADADAAAEPEPAALADLRDLPAHAVAEQRVLGFAYAAPLAGEATSDFGWREHPTTGREAFHYGVDLAAEEGTAVACFADGTVGVTAESVELGKYVTVHHARGVTTLYAHLSRVSVSSGDTVRLGDTLGEVGSTGNATGPHLHFEVHDGEDYLNPQYYL